MKSASHQPNPYRAALWSVSSAKAKAAALVADCYTVALARAKGER